MTRVTPGRASGPDVARPRIFTFSQASVRSAICATEIEEEESGCGPEICSYLGMSGLIPKTLSRAIPSLTQQVLGGSRRCD